jgi:intein/homing endonuclease
MEQERETTFNLEVGTYHNYFAGDMLVHNKPMCLP